MNNSLGLKFPNILGLCKAIPLILTAMVLMGVNCTSYATVIAMSSSLDLGALSGRDTFEVTDFGNASQGAAINTLGAISVNATSTSAGGTSITSGSGTATWNNTAQGQVSFDALGWDNRLILIRLFQSAALLVLNGNILLSQI